MLYITHGYNKHVCFQIYFRSTLFSAHGNLFWQNSEWVPVVRAPLKREAAPLKGIHSPLSRSIALRETMVPQAQTEKTRQPFLARHRLLFLGKETASHNCFFGGRWAGQMLEQKCDDTASQQPCGSQGSAVCSLPQRQQKSFSDTGAKYTAVGTGFPWEISMFFWSEILRLIPSKVR